MVADDTSLMGKIYHLIRNFDLDSLGRSQDSKTNGFLYLTVTSGF